MRIHAPVTFSFLLLLLVLPFCLAQLSPGQNSTMAGLAGLIGTSSWNTTSPNPCSWHGVTCAGSDVTGLSLSGLSLTVGARFFSYLCQLGSLQSLDLSGNSVTSLPGEFLSNCSGLDGLTSLNLSKNALRGSLPDFSGFAGLMVLDLSRNSLIGTIGSQLNRLSQLRFLDLSFNLFSGSVPTQLGKGTALESMQLSHNNFSGSIPQELFIYGNNLTFLDLSFNSLSGFLSLSIANLSKLEILLLSSNLLNGQIPNELSQLSRLSTLNLSSNHLTGAIPPTIFGIPDELNGSSGSLLFVNLNGNELNGSIPDAVGNGNRLLELQLGDNMLSGDIPKMPGKLEVALNLSGNNFSGPIPETLQELQNLEVLDLSDNEFTGEVPQFLSDLMSLRQLDISNNQLFGILPKFSCDVTWYGNSNLTLEKTQPTKIASSKKNRTVWLVVNAIFTAAFAIGLVALGYKLISRQSYQVQDESLPCFEQRPVVILGSHILTADAIHRSSIDFIKALEAVDSPANLLLKSMFVAYYKAIMPSGRSYCVKKLNWGDNLVQLGNNEKFEEVMEVLGGITNSRIMTPLAYALTSDNAFLFYEPAHMGTLFDFFQSSSGGSSDWSTRYSIALGVAQGLFFLHEFQEPFILLDLSSKSILLKSINEPLIADIELHRVIDTSNSTGSFSRFAGSVGYTPPEYSYTMKVSMEGNVYSFGVILLELLTGKPPVCEGIELANWVKSKSAQNRQFWDEILDSRISSVSVAVRNQMLSVLKVARACASVSPDARPKMKNVVWMLLNAR